MNKNQGAATIALVLAALVGVNYLPRAGRDTGAETPKAVESSANPSNHRRVTPATPATPIPNEPCTEIGGLLARFYNGLEKVPYPKSCYKAEEQPPELTPSNNPRLRVVIALLPNPISTHFSLFFDRGVEAIQQAAQDEGFAYDSSWFPWNDETRQYDRLKDDLDSQDRKHNIESQPGIMVFRRASWPGGPDHPYREGLFVLVVGEQPTRGISDSEFENALKWFANMAPMPQNHVDPEPLRVLGPTTSGALPSLHRELEQNCDKWWQRPPLMVFSGSVSSPDNVGWFRNAMKDLTTHGPDPRAFDDRPVPNCKGPISEAVFHTYNESDDLLTDRFCAYLSDQGYDLDKVAFLSEDETAFGSFVRGDIAEGDKSSQANNASANKPNVCGNATQLYYPRDIAALRAAYEKQSVFATGKPAANAPTSSLRSDLSEPTGGEHDTVRAYGGQLDPLAQEAVLQAIVEQLRDRRIQFVVVRSSNPLDQAFLSQFLRRSYPEGRVVLGAADLLFLRSRQDVSLRGVIVLSTYPLLADQKEWTPALRAKHQRALHTFGQDSVESIYLAARNLFGRGSEQKASEPIYDYLPPLWASESAKPGRTDNGSRPATWLTVIGHRQFWPLAAIEAIPCEKKKPEQSSQEEKAKQPSEATFTLDCDPVATTTPASTKPITDSLLAVATQKEIENGGVLNPTGIVFLCR